MKRREFVALLGGAVAWPLAARAQQPVDARSGGLDPRITPARRDLAAKHLAGVVEAQRFVEGKAYEIGTAQAPVRKAPSHKAELLTEALKGERATIYDISEDGWAWGQLAGDGYVGFVPASALCASGPPATHKVTALRTFVFPGPSIKLPPVETLSFGCQLVIARIDGLFAMIASGGHVPVFHLVPVETMEADFVAVAERFLGTPYLWGERAVSASTTRDWCSLRSPPAASLVRATPTCRSGHWAARSRASTSLSSCGEATLCSGRAMSRLCGTKRRWCMPSPPVTWRSPSRLPRKRSAAFAQQAASSSACAACRRPPEVDLRRLVFRFCRRRAIGPAPIQTAPCSRTGQSFARRRAGSRARCGLNWCGTDSWTS